MVECPSCKGTGRIAYTDYEKEWTSRGRVEVHISGYTTCYRCRGLGEVTKEEAESRP